MKHKRIHYVEDERQYIITTTFASLSKEAPFFMWENLWRIKEMKFLNDTFNGELLPLGYYLFQ